MTILPVLDLLGGRVVRGVAGKRTEYRPIVSRWTSSCDPHDVACALRTQFGVSRFYVADLDAILSRQPNSSCYQRLLTSGFELLIDAGIRTVDDARNIAATGVTGLIVGLETCCSPDELKRIVEESIDVTFSLDLMSGRPIKTPSSREWSDDPGTIIRQAVEAGTRSILVLDLADVGMGTGGSTDALCRFAKDNFPDVQLLAGGGVRGPQDLMRFHELGVDAVLVASALHDGRLEPTRNSTWPSWPGPPPQSRAD